MGRSKIIFDGEVLIDLTEDTVTPERLLAGYTAHGKDGETITGSCAFDVDSSDATAAQAEILYGKTAAVRGAMVTGTMPNRGSVIGSISAKGEQYGVPQGYHDGGGKVGIAQDEQNKLIPDNIREGVTILGVVGAMSGAEDFKPQQKTVTPKATAQTILPDAGYNALSQVTVEAVPYEEAANSAGGITVTIL